MKIATVAEMRTLDRRAGEDFAIPESILMENAGLAAYTLLSRLGGVAGRRFLLVCGPGNNGGDGLVVARLLASGGGRVQVYLAAEAEKFTGAAKGNLVIARKMGLALHQAESPAVLQRYIAHSDVVVDALLGTGLSREVTGSYRELISLMNEKARMIVSLDIPSGICGDRGDIMGEAVRATCTVTFGLPKTGNMLHPGYRHCGRLYLSHISFPPELSDAANLRIQTNDHIPLPARPPEAHKGMMGKALVVAGSERYGGAPYFAALSFLRGGGGYVYLAAPRSLAPHISQKGSEIVVLPQQETAEGSIGLSNRDQLLALAGQVDVVIIGPGMSLNGETGQLVRELIPLVPKPLLIDGDGITALAMDSRILRDRQAPTILTPHPGEMARLAGGEAASLERRRIEILQETAERLGAFVVLKGAHSLIGTPDRRVFLNMSGNSGMATAGSGDVLAGAIAAMSGLGLPLEEAVRKGVFIHGLAGDLAALERGEDGMIASDIMAHLPAALKRDREEPPEELRAGYDIPLLP